MPDHAVGRIDRLISPYSRQPEQQQPEERRHDAVAEALRQALYAGPRHTGFIQRSGVTPHDSGHRPPRGIQFASFQSADNWQHMDIKTVLRQRWPGRERQTQPGPGTAPAADRPFQRQTHASPRAEQQQEEGESRPAP